MSIKNFIMLFLSGVINAIGVTIFIAPVNLYDSGISGTSILLSQLTPEYLSLSVFLIALNVPLFLFGLKRQGAAFTIYAIFAVAIYSISAWLITDVLPVDVSIASPLAGDDLLLCALFGGMISGIGSGLSIRYGGAMDGIEVIAVIFAKRIGITVGTFVMGYNVILYLASGVILKSWILPLYSIVTYAAALKTIDFIVEGIDAVGERIGAQDVLVRIGEHEEVFHLALAYLFRRGIFDAALLDAHVYDVGHIIRQRQITLRLHRQQDHRQQDGQRELLEALEDFFHNISFLRIFES